MPPIDPNTGLFDPYEVRHSPGPGGAGSPLGGILDFLNAFKGQNLANQSQAMRDIAGMHAQQNLQPMDYSQVPGAADVLGTATGLGPQGASAMEQGLPAMQFRQRVADLSQQYPEGIPTQELESAALETGQNVPGLYSYLGRQAGVGQQEQKNFGVLLQKEYQAALQGADTDKEARRKAADILLTTHPNMAAVLERFVQAGTDAPSPYAAARKGKTEAQATQATAAAKAAEARANYLDKIADPTAAERYAQAGLAGARQALINVQTQIEKIKADNGGVLPEAQKPRLLALLTQLEGKQLSASAMQGVGIKPDPAAVADIKNAIKEVKAQLAGGKTEAPAKKKQTYNPATDTFE